MKDIILALAIAISAMLEQDPARAAGLDTVADLTGPMPTGITVAPNGRIFINYPQWGDNPGYAVAELRDGVPVPYPDTALNTPRGTDPETHLLSVQSVVADARDRLWILDTGAPGFAAPVAERLMALAWWDWDHATLRDRLEDFRSLPIEAFLEKYA